MKSVLLLAGIEVALAGWFGYNFLHLPGQRQMAFIRGQSAQEQATQQTQAEVAGLLNALEEQRGPLAPEPDPSWLVRQMVALADKSGLQLTTIAQEPPQELEQYTRLGALLQFSASYHQLGTFLDEIERSPYFIRVDRISLIPASEREQPASVRLGVSTIYVPPILNR